MTGPHQPERRPSRAAFVIAAVLAVLGAVMLWDAARLPQAGGYAGVGPADVPRLVAIGLLILSALTLIAGARGELPGPPRQNPVPVLWVLGGLVAQLILLRPVSYCGPGGWAEGMAFCTPLLWVSGFCIAGAVLFGCAARGLGQRPLALTTAVGLVLAMAIYGVFDRLLRLNLPEGPLERLIFGG